MIVFKHSPENADIEREIAQLDQRLGRIVNVMENLAWSMWRDVLVCTSIKRTVQVRLGDTHFNQKKPFRFVDFAMLENGDSELLRHVVNLLFPYGTPGYETIPPLDHGSAPHFHVQVKP